MPNTKEAGEKGEVRSSSTARVLLVPVVCTEAALLEEPT